MKKSKFTEAQIIFAIKQSETGVSVGEVCRKMGISEATFLGLSLLSRDTVNYLDAKQT